VSVNLGEFLFDGISPAPAEANREVIVRFDYDVNGIVQVSAIDKQTNRSDGITITASRERMSAAEKADIAKRQLKRGLEAYSRTPDGALMIVPALASSTIVVAPAGSKVG
jgi:molecular chaperone DnaK (HSP70)